MFFVYLLFPDKKYTVSEFAFPSCIINGTAVTRTFQILYRNEEIRLDDIARFKVHAIVDGSKVGQSLVQTEFLPYFVHRIQRRVFLMRLFFCYYTDRGDIGDGRLATGARVVVHRTRQRFVGHAVGGLGLWTLQP